MSEVTTIRLESLEGIGSLQFVSAQWWNKASRFVLVTMANAKGEETVLRMDINKQAFIDRVDDEGVNEIIERSALPLWTQIVAARRAQAVENAHYFTAGGAV